MRLAPSLLVLIAVSALAGTACRRAEPPPPPPPAPVTGWSSGATREVSRTLVEAAAGHAWVARFREMNGRMPVVEVGEVEDRTGDNVPVDELQAELLRVLAASDRALAAGPGQVADATLGGRISLAAGLFQVDLRIIDRAGEVLWYNGIEVRRSEPLPPAPPAPAPGKG